MSDMYGIIESLCESKGIKPGRLCTDLGISRGTISDLKAGRTKKLSTDVSKKIADYFGVSVDYLLGQEEKPTAEDDGLAEYLEMLKNRPECRMLFQLSRDATKAEVEEAVRIIEAIRRKD